MQKRVLFITTQLPYPPVSGGVIKSYRLLNFLVKRYNVSLFTLLKNQDKEFEKALISQLNPSVYFGLDLNIKRSVKTYLNSIIKGKTINEYRNYSSTFQQKIKKESLESDLIFVDHFEMYQYVPTDFKRKVILHEHNAEWVLWERFAYIETNFIKSKLLHFEANRIKAKELKAVKNASLTFAAPNDCLAFKNNGIRGDKLSVTYHLGNDELLNLTSLEFEKLPEAILFMGTLSWEANIDGLQYFLNSIFPLILNKKPNIKFKIIGKNPDVRLIEAAKPFKELVEFKGFVKNIETVFLMGKVFVLPLRFGSGMKVKFLDALYRGMPIVSSSVGAEGIEIGQSKEALIADNAEAFANAILQLIEDQRKWKAMSTAQTILAKKNYTWEKHFNKIGEELSLLFNNRLS